MAAINLEEVNKVNVLTDRVKKRRDAYLAATPQICSQRSRLVTQSWQETEGEPLVLRRAKLFKKMLQGLTVVIREGELIVGSQTKYVRGASPFVDYTPEPFLEAVYDEELTAKLTMKDEMVSAVLADEDRESLLEDAKYWIDKAPGVIVKRQMRQALGEQIDDYIEEHVISPSPLDHPMTVGNVDYGKVIDKGLKGVIAEIDAEIESMDLARMGSWEKYEFLKAGTICCEAVIDFAQGYAAEALKMAKNEKDATRKQELEKIADICKWVPANPARSYHEALQSFWFTHLVFNLETANNGQAPGRMDQYLYPAYEKDIREGVITRQEAAELLGCVWVKLNEMEVVANLRQKKIAQATQFQNVTICGVTEDGKDATNEFSFLMLEVTRQMKMPQPPLYLRYHDRINRDVLVKAVETNRDHIAGSPAFVNDAVMMPKLTARGVSIKDARNCMLMGCLSYYTTASSSGANGPIFNKVKAFELALYNGVEPKTGKQLGPATGDPTTFKSYDELYNAYLTQLKHVVDIGVKTTRVGAQARAGLFCMPFQSILTNDCIKTGKDIHACGARYPQIDVIWGDSGHQNLADSLTAIKKLVFNDKRITMAELIEGLKANFEGKDDLHKTLLAAPKYGNDDDYADQVFNEVSLDSSRIMAEPLDLAGYPMYITRGGGAQHYWAGVTMSALPDGRKAWEAQADASLSPVQGRDVKGPTAVILSASKANQTEYSMTALFNMKITRAMMQTREQIDKLLALIKTYFDRGGWHIQFNIVDQATLIEAKKHPEQYRDLLVRVAGYSAYFVELSPKVQDEIIARTAHSL